MSVNFDTPIARSKIKSLKLSADNTQIKVAVVLTCEDGSTLGDVCIFKPSELPATAKDWFESACKDKIAAKYS